MAGRDKGKCMNKKVLLTLAAVAAIAIGVVGMSAFEAHVINVIAKIENALSVDTTAIDFGTVFPQEELNYTVDISLSGSFIEEDSADDVNYVIKQKPKCRLKDGITDLPLYGRVTEVNDVYVCVDEANYEMLPVLCPYLSKHDADPEDGNDESLDAFHGSVDWTIEDSDITAVAGRLAKSQNDETDSWTIDLKVPCFEGHCAQDWVDYVTGINPDANPEEFVQPMANEHAEFGCDLWIEVTEISRVSDLPTGWVTLSLENKDDEYWFVETDGTHGVLQFNPAGEEFEFNLSVQGMQASTDYKLVYAPDPWPQSLPESPNLMIHEFTTDPSGEYSVNGASKEMDMDFPDSDDENYASGAKIWVVLADHHDNTQMTAWDHTKYLFEYNLITYEDTGTP